jgi:hypothetical protein
MGRSQSSWRSFPQRRGPVRLETALTEIRALLVGAVSEGARCGWKTHLPRLWFCW